MLVFHTWVGTFHVSREPNGWYWLAIPRLTPEYIDTLLQEIAEVFPETACSYFRNFEDTFIDLGNAMLYAVPFLTLQRLLFSDLSAL